MDSQFLKVFGVACFIILFLLLFWGGNKGRTRRRSQVRYQQTSSEIEMPRVESHLSQIEHTQNQELVLKAQNLELARDWEKAALTYQEAGLYEEVSDRLDESGLSLSGGQQQRLCIARTIAVNPEVILMDEPCSALDPIATARIENLIDELSEKFSIVIVTHSMQQAARVSQRVAYFHLGRLVEVDDTEKVFTNPSHILTQDYITGRIG